MKIAIAVKKLFRDEIPIRNNTLKIKYCGDSANITRSNVKVLNFAFTLINDIESAKSVHGNYIIGF